MPTKKSIVSFKRKSFKRKPLKSTKMALGRKRRVYRKRRTFRRRGRYHRRQGRGPSALIHNKIKRIGGLEGTDRTSVKLRYVYRTAYTAGGIADLSIKLNSIYDCGGTNDNDNAQGYLLYYNYFSRSRVHASSINVKMINADTTTSIEPIDLIIVPCTASNLAILAASTDWMAMLNQPHAKRCTMFGGKGRTSLSHYCKVGTLAGYASLPLSSSIGAWGSTAGADPTQLYSWYIGTNNMAGTTSNDLQMEVSVVYYVDFTEPFYEADQELATHRRTILGNDFGGTIEEYKKYREEHKSTKTHINKLVSKPAPAEEKKALPMKVEEPQEFELIKVPKLKTPVPLSR